MKPEEIVAYIGAAAWIPQIATWLYRKFIVPSIRIIPNQYAEVGFTSSGPIFNVRMAISVEQRDVILDGMEMLIRHEDGDSRTLRWAGLGETFSEITDAAGNKQVVSRDMPPIALKIGTMSLLEKFVRFQDQKYHEDDRPLVNALITHFNYLKQAKPDTYVADTLASKELFSVLEARKKTFWWKAGRYDISISLSSPRKFKLANPDFHFELSVNDVDFLKKNLVGLDTEMTNLVSSNLPDFKIAPLNWNWANVNVR